MKKQVKVKAVVVSTIEVLGQELTRAEAEALYHELGQELKMAPVSVPYPYPVYPRGDWWGVTHPVTYGDNTAVAPDLPQHTQITCDTNMQNAILQ
jgi:hypothetical protein